MFRGELTFVGQKSLDLKSVDPLLGCYAGYGVLQVHLSVRSLHWSGQMAHVSQVEISIYHADWMQTCFTNYPTCLTTLTVCRIWRC